MPNAPRYYSTLAAVRTREKNTGATFTAEDTGRYLGKIRAATSMIERYTARVFEPVQETRYFDWREPYYLDFADADNLAVTTVVDGLGRTINSASVVPLGSRYLTSGPFYGVRIDPSKGEFLSHYLVKERAIQVTGTWGYHDDYANAWHDTGVTLNGSITNSATSITTTTNNGVDLWGFYPALSEGMLIQVDTEWMRVVSIVSSTSITVARAQNGTSAAAHNNAATIQVYTPPIDIVEITTRFAALILNMDDTTFGKTVITALGTEIPAGMPADVCQALDMWKKRRVA